MSILTEARAWLAERDIPGNQSDQRALGLVRGLLDHVEACAVMGGSAAVDAIPRPRQTTHPRYVSKMGMTAAQAMELADNVAPTPALAHEALLVLRSWCYESLHACALGNKRIDELETALAAFQEAPVSGRAILARQQALHGPTIRDATIADLSTKVAMLRAALIGFFGGFAEPETLREELELLSIAVSLGSVDKKDTPVIEAGIRALLATSPVPAANMRAAIRTRKRTGTVEDIEDDDLLRRAVRNAGRGRAFEPRWSHVADVFALGSTFAAELCRRFALDPDEHVGQVPEAEEADDE